MDIARWIVAVWLLAAIPENWRIHYLQEKRPNTAPFYLPFAGVLGVIGVLIAPIEGRLPYCWIPLFLDVWHWEMFFWVCRGFKPKSRD